MEAESEIAKWYHGKAIFITGATGFMGKVLVEKLIRSCPDVGPIYVLVREKKEVSPQNRVEEMVTSCLYDELRNSGVNPRDRLVAISGDVSMPELGISSEDRRLLEDTVSVVFHVAATVKFDEPMRLAVAMNLEGTKAMLELCKGMKNLCAVVHVSTAYTNCNLSVIEERVYPPPADPDKVLQYVSGLEDDVLDLVTPRLISGHPNTYTFTKALAENLIARYSTELPIVVVRPSIVTASWKEPQPGWVDSFNGPTVLVAAAAKGALKTLYGHNHKRVDLIPVDVCVNLFIAAAWEIGKVAVFPRSEQYDYSYIRKMRIRNGKNEVRENPKKYTKEPEMNKSMPTNAFENTKTPIWKQEKIVECSVGLPDDYAFQRLDIPADDENTLIRKEQSSDNVNGTYIPGDIYRQKNREEDEMQESLNKDSKFKVRVSGEGEHPKDLSNYAIDDSLTSKTKEDRKDEKEAEFDASLELDTRWHLWHEVSDVPRNEEDRKKAMLNLHRLYHHEINTWYSKNKPVKFLPMVTFKGKRPILQWHFSNL